MPVIYKGEVYSDEAWWLLEQRLGPGWCRYDDDDDDQYWRKHWVEMEERNTKDDEGKLAKQERKRQAEEERRARLRRQAKEWEEGRAQRQQQAEENEKARLRRKEEEATEGVEARTRRHQQAEEEKGRREKEEEAERQTQLSRQQKEEAEERQAQRSRQQREAEQRALYRREDRHKGKPGGNLYSGFVRWVLLGLLIWWFYPRAPRHPRTLAAEAKAGTLSAFEEKMAPWATHWSTVEGRTTLRMASIEAARAGHVHILDCLCREWDVPINIIPVDEKVGAGNTFGHSGDGRQGGRGAAPAFCGRERRIPDPGEEAG